jgi:PmbA protein
MTEFSFEYSTQQLEQIAKEIVNRSITLGASGAFVEVNEYASTNIEILKGSIENFETSYTSGLSIAVYKGYHCGVAGISQITLENIDKVINQALDIAKYTQEDLAGGLPFKEDLTSPETCLALDLQLYNPSAINNLELIERAKKIEALTLSLSDKITSSEGSSISYSSSNFAISNSHGLSIGYLTTRYNTSISIIGENSDGMQTDYWYSSTRDYKDLILDENLAHRACNRLLRRLNKGTIQSNNYPVIFEAGVANLLISAFIGAINGNSLYRGLSFLNNSIATQVFPSWLNIVEDPFIVKGLSSCYFDNEGVKVKRRNLVENGVIQGYLLSSYSARKMGLTTTGNAGGNHNIIVNSNFNGNLEELSLEMGRGLIIIETIGHGINGVTGDFSLGVSGLWVEGGEIKFFVDNLTIAGNLKDLYSRIKYIAHDINYESSIWCGSILIDGVQVGA